MFKKAAIVSRSRVWRVRALAPAFGLCAFLCLPPACDPSENAGPASPESGRPTGTTPTANDLFLDAAGRGDLAGVRAYLREGAASIQARDGLGSSALLLAVRKTDNLELVKFLYGADPKALDAGDNRDRTPLSWAAHFDRPQIVSYLVETGAEIENRDRGGNTPLMYAAMRDARGSAEILLKHGANVNARNDLCDTALMLAAAKGYVAMVALLVKHQADPGYEDREGRTVADRLQHIDPATREKIQSLLKQAPRSAMNPACKKQ